ncbi:hypothetical protein ARMSODRAFT_301692 [Armillaria solidipes]|uniref:Uncharacterized protein n=1 Tax=Armillaria solidipes TaxID=1076256 RepID=A0A2H3BXM9_9AGAR|nr:hypothetical protein ARMSODRAFT_301692 [Armillaria solidipes]
MSAVSYTSCASEYSSVAVSWLPSAMVPRIGVGRYRSLRLCNGPWQYPLIISVVLDGFAYREDASNLCDAGLVATTDLCAVSRITARRYASPPNYHLGVDNNVIFDPLKHRLSHHTFSKLAFTLLTSFGLVLSLATSSSSTSLVLFRSPSVLAFLPTQPHISTLDLYLQIMRFFIAAVVTAFIFAFAQAAAIPRISRNNIPRDARLSRSNPVAKYNGDASARVEVRETAPAADSSRMIKRVHPRQFRPLES